MDLTNYISDIGDIRGDVLQEMTEALLAYPSADQLPADSFNWDRYRADLVVPGEQGQWDSQRAEQLDWFNRLAGQERWRVKKVKCEICGVLKARYYWVELPPQGEGNICCAECNGQIYVSSEGEVSFVEYVPSKIYNP
jgi:hypothetical protein